jgi:hypothetical protein
VSAWSVVITAKLSSCAVENYESLPGRDVGMAVRPTNARKETYNSHTSRIPLVRLFLTRLFPNCRDQEVLPSSNVSELYLRAARLASRP